jgi:23S rRNA (cytosine1962-C5)-methyltransferase
LIVDRYDDVLVMQTLSQGTDARKSLLIEILVDELSPRHRTQRRARAPLEGLPYRDDRYATRPRSWRSAARSTFHVEPGRTKDRIVFWTSVRTVLPRAPQPNDRKQRALDCFTFNGAFALHLASVCESDRYRYLGRSRAAQRNAALNGIRTSIS